MANPTAITRGQVIVPRSTPEQVAGQPAGKLSLDPANLEKSSHSFVSALGYDAFTFRQGHVVREGAEPFFDYINAELLKFETVDDKISFLNNVMDKLSDLSQNADTDNKTEISNEHFRSAVEEIEVALMGLLKTLPHSEAVDQKIERTLSKWRDTSGQPLSSQVDESGARYFKIDGQWLNAHQIAAAA